MKNRFIILGNGEGWCEKSISALLKKKMFSFITVFQRRIQIIVRQ